MYCKKCGNETQDNSNICQNCKEKMGKYRKNILAIIKKISIAVIIVITLILAIFLLNLVSINSSRAKTNISSINISENFPNGKPKIKTTYDKNNKQLIITSYYENGMMNTQLFVSEKFASNLKVFKNILDDFYICDGMDWLNLILPSGETGINIHRLQYYKSGNLSIDCNYVLYYRHLLDIDTMFTLEVERQYNNEYLFTLPDSSEKLEGVVETYYDSKHREEIFDEFGNKKLEFVPNIKGRYQFKNGNKYGIQQEYYDNGQTKYKYFEGIETFYYPNGAKRKIADHKKGVAKTYYPNENLRSEYLYKNGKVEGKYTEYYINGNIKYIINYKKGKPLDGTMYDEEGTPTAMTNAHLNNGRFLEF